jgi:hypothetical protein
MFVRTARFLGLVLVAMAGIFQACESDLNAPVRGTPRLTIHANLSPQGWQPQRVYVYNSLSATDSSSFLTPAGLTVVMTDQIDGETLTLDSVRQGGRVFFPIPDGFVRAGHTYSITASAPGYEEVRAVTQVPQASAIRSLDIAGLTISPSDKNEFKEIIRYTLVLEIEHLDDNRYYHLVFYNEYQGLPGQFFIVNPEPADDQLFLRHYDYGVLIDKRDLRSDVPLTFDFVDWVVQDQGLKRVYAELRTISEDYYKYHSSLARQIIVRQDPFAEPVSIYNNIQGGYGNFSGFNPYVSSSGLPE